MSNNVGEFEPVVAALKEQFGAKLIDEMNASLPTEPGKYRDGDRHGDWTLHKDGRWEDETGDIRPADWNFVLVLTGFDPIKID